MKTHVISIVALGICLMRSEANAAAYTFELITAPGYTETWGYGINNAGQVVFAAGSNEVSFLRDLSGSLTQLDYPGRTPTVALGINNLGIIVGDAYNSPTGSYIGFTRAVDGGFTNFAYPGAVGPTGGMQVNDINDAGVILGIYTASPTDSGTFIRSTTGQVDTFRYLNNPNTNSYGINNAGEISGTSSSGSFLRHPDGSFTSISVPGATETQAFGINNLGQIAGLYVNNGVHGFVRDSNGSFQTIDVPDAQNTHAWSINDFGQIVGITRVANRTYAFIGTPSPETPGPGTPVPESSGAIILLTFGLCVTFALRFIQGIGEHQ